MVGSLVLQDLTAARRSLRGNDIQCDVVSYGQVAENSKALDGVRRPFWCVVVVLVG